MTNRESSPPSLDKEEAEKEDEKFRELFSDLLDRLSGISGVPSEEVDFSGIKKLIDELDKLKLQSDSQKGEQEKPTAESDKDSESEKEASESGQEERVKVKAEDKPKDDQSESNKSENKSPSQEKVESMATDKGDILLGILEEIKKNKENILAEWQEKGADDIDSEHQQKMAWHQAYTNAPEPLKAQADTKRQAWAQLEEFHQDDYTDPEQFALQTGEAMLQVVADQIERVNRVKNWQQLIDSMTARQREILAEWQEKGADDIDSEHQQKMAWHQVYNEVAHEIQAKIDSLRRQWAESENLEDYINETQFALQTGEALRQIIEADKQKLEKDQKIINSLVDDLIKDDEAKEVKEVEYDEGSVIGQSNIDLRMDEDGLNMYGDAVGQMNQEKPPVLELDNDDEYAAEARKHGWFDDDKESKTNTAPENSIPTPASEKTEPQSNELEQANKDLDQARQKYYEARRKRMRWIGRGSKSNLEQLRQNYNKALSTKIRTELKDKIALEQQITEQEKDDGYHERVGLWFAALDVDLRRAENQKVWQEEFDASEKSLTTKFEGWWRKHGKKRMVVSAALLGAGFIPGLNFLTVPVRAGLRGVGGGMLVEQSLGRWSKALGDRGLANKLYSEHKKELKQGNLDGLKKRLSDMPAAEVQAEINRLTVLAERQGVGLMDVSHGKKGQLKPVIDTLYEANLVKMYETTLASQEKGQEAKTAEGVLDLLDSYQKNIHLLEEGRGQKERKKEISRWAISAIAGTAMAAIPFMSYGQETSEGAVATQESIQEAPPVVVGEVAPAVAAESPAVIPDVVAPTAGPDLYQGALDAASEVGADGHNSVWAVLEAKAEAVAGGAEAGLGEGKFTYLIDSIKDQIAANPGKFGLPADIDHISAEQLQAFAENDSLNELVAGSFINQANGDVADLLKEAQGLSSEAVANIEANNDFYNAVVAEARGSGVSFDQEMYNLMDQAKEAGLNSAQTAELVSSVGSIPAESLPQVVDFYASHPGISPSTGLSDLVAQHGAETASKVAEMTGGNISPAVERLISAGYLDLSDMDLAAPWIRLTELVSPGPGPVSSEAIKAIFPQDQIGNLEEINNIRKSKGILSFVANITGQGPISFVINTNKMSIGAEPQSVPGIVVAKTLFSYAKENPVATLKKVFDSVTKK